MIELYLLFFLIFGVSYLLSRLGYFETPLKIISLVAALASIAIILVLVPDLLFLKLVFILGLILSIFISVMQENSRQQRVKQELEREKEEEKENEFTKYWGTLTKYFR